MIAFVPDPPVFTALVVYARQPPHTVYSRPPNFILCVLLNSLTTCERCSFYFGCGLFMPCCWGSGGCVVPFDTADTVLPPPSQALATLAGRCYLKITSTVASCSHPKLTVAGCHSPKAYLRENILNFYRTQPYHGCGRLSNYPHVQKS